MEDEHSPHEHAGNGPAGHDPAGQAQQEHEHFEHKHTARGRVFLWGGVLLGALLVALLLTHGFGLLLPAPEPAEEPALVHQGARIFVPESSALRKRLVVAPAAALPRSGRLVVPGIIESDPRRTAAVLTPLGGRILQVNVGLGDHVVRGQTLAVLDSPDLAQAVEDDIKARDALKLADKNLEREEGQSKIGAASDRDLDQARNDRLQAAAEYARTQAHLRTLDVEPRGERPRELVVRAPIAGSVVSLSASPGSMVNDPTQPLMTVADISTVWATALVPEERLGTVSKDEDAEVTVLGHPPRTLRGKVLFVSDVIDPDARRDKVRIAFANDDRALKPNMFATVTLRDSAQPRIVLPTSALLMNNDRTSVFVAVAPWTFERRNVEPQLEEGPTVSILSGIEAGEQVVIRGGILLND